MHVRDFLILPLILLLFGTGTAFAWFGSHGIVTTSFGNSACAQSLLLQPDGKLVAGGYSYNGQNNFTLARYNGDGSLDSSFGAAGTGKVVTCLGSNTPSGIADMVLQPDGKIVVAGGSTFQTSEWPEPCPSIVLGRYTGDGILDADHFGNNGTTHFYAMACSRGANCLTLQSDGKLVAAGWYSPPAPSVSMELVRVDNAGNPDMTFGNGGWTRADIGGWYNPPDVSYAWAKSVVAQSDGKLMAAGYCYFGSYSVKSIALARFNNNGGLDTSFDGDGKMVTTIGNTTDCATSLVFQTDGKFIVAGYSFNGSNLDFALVRYNTIGSPDMGFGAGGRVVTPIGDGDDAAADLILQPDGKLVAAGYSFNGGDLDFALVRYNSNGSLDVTFGNGGKVVTPIGAGDDAANSLILQSDGKLVAAGYSFNGVYNDFVLARYKSDGSLDENGKPVISGFSARAGLAKYNIDLTLAGADLNEINLIQLRNNNGTVTGTGLTLTADHRLGARFSLPPSPGLYELYVSNQEYSFTQKAAFTVLSPVQPPVQWEVSDLGKAGNPAVSDAGSIAVADADRDGRTELYVVDGDRMLFRFKKNSAWTVDYPLETSGESMEELLAADGNRDGEWEIYAASGKPQMHQCLWNGAWQCNTVCSHGLRPAWGDGNQDGLNELYLVSGNTETGHGVVQYGYDGSNWSATTVVDQQAIYSFTALLAGDADNDRTDEVYAANQDHYIYKLHYSGGAWQKSIVLNLGNSATASLALGDLDRDGANELYAANRDGNIYQLKWTDAVWQSVAINGAPAVCGRIAIGDADNDGQDELCGAGQDGHARLWKLAGGSWQMTDLGDAGASLNAIAVGDGDNDFRNEVYAVGADAHILQFRAVSLAPPVTTATPVPESEKRLRIIPSRINPLKNEIAHIRWYQPDDAGVTLIVYNLLGDKIITLAENRPCAAGRLHEVCWDGKTANGSAAGSGIYVVCIQAGSYKAWAKAAVVK